ncbi:transcriptional regulator [Actinoallomurus sp. CA-150999]|uniref:transcriptional regulator n=1 Tax=Actinoallomurus sp. CA-150999 TaxID=3239887 RepID=UPI003D90A5B5
MYDVASRNRALELLAQGLTVAEVSRRTQISRWAIRDWQLRADQGMPVAPARSCPRCGSQPTSLAPEDKYAYLLGLYLGDGCISPVGDPAKRIWSLRIFCADKYPGLQTECADAIRAIRPDNKVRFLPLGGCTEINSHSKHWPCMFPQHGPGKKHTRKITLDGWQQELVERFTKPFVRGLIHSDGSRSTNRVRHATETGDRWYEYPRYFFTNESADITQLFTDALDRLGIAWRHSNRNNISVARRDAVARLDGFVGPKY